VHLLDAPSPALDGYLRDRGWVPRSSRVVALEPAGEGNMNLVRRARLDTGDTLVLKHGRPFVEKYPSIAAPEGRTSVEGRFYAHVQTAPEVARMMPRFLGFDAGPRILALEDCAGRDCSYVYGGTPLADDLLVAAAEYLAALHRMPLDADASRAFGNHEMRALNHAHIFDIPLHDDTGVDLDALCPGLSSAARAVRADRRFVATVHALGREYLSADGPALLHGDSFPGSWLDTSAGLKVIDPEFCFPGPPAFDLGVTVAHLRLAGAPPRTSQAFLTRYAEDGDPIDAAVVSAWAGVEIMRRLLGVAQLPLDADVARRQALLEEARALVMGAATVEAS